MIGKLIERETQRLGPLPGEQGQLGLPVGFEVVERKLLEVGDQHEARHLVPAVGAGEVADVVERLEAGGVEVLAAALVFDEQLALPEQVDERMLAAHVAGVFLERGKRRAPQPEHVEKLVPEGLLLAGFRGVGGVATDELLRAGMNFLPGKMDHRLVRTGRSPPPAPKPPMTHGRVTTENGRRPPAGARRRPRRSLADGGRPRRLPGQDRPAAGPGSFSHASSASRNGSMRTGLVRKPSIPACRQRTRFSGSASAGSASTGTRAGAADASTERCSSRDGMARVVSRRRPSRPQAVGTVATVWRMREAIL